jgi:hypothetical protein
MPLASDARKDIVPVLTLLRLKHSLASVTSQGTTVYPISYFSQHVQSVRDIYPEDKRTNLHFGL